MKVRRNAECTFQVPNESIEGRAREMLRGLTANADAGSLRIELTITVPSGGDYSGTTLDLDELPVTCKATWTETEDVDE